MLVPSSRRSETNDGSRTRSRSLGRLRLASAFDCWCTGAASLRRDAFCDSRCVGDGSPLASRLFRRAAGVVSARDAATPRARRVAGMLARLSDRTLARCFAVWMDAAEDRASPPRGVSSLASTSSRASSPFLFSLAISSTRRRVKKLFAKCARRVAVARAASFDRWREIHARTARDAARRAAESRASGVARPSSRLASDGGLRRAFSGWRERAGAHVRERRALAKIASRWSRLETACAFDDWRAWFETRVESASSSRRTGRNSRRRQRTVTMARLRLEAKLSPLEKRRFVVRGGDGERALGAVSADGATRRRLDEGASASAVVASRWTRRLFRTFGTWAGRRGVSEDSKVTRKCRVVVASAFDAWRDATEPSGARVPRRGGASVDPSALARPGTSGSSASKTRRRRTSPSSLRAPTRRVWTRAGFAVDRTRRRRARVSLRASDRRLASWLHLRWMREAFTALVVHAKEACTCATPRRWWRRIGDAAASREFAAWRGVASRRAARGNSRARRRARCGAARMRFTIGRTSSSSTGA